MRKLDKTLILATDYKSCQDKLEADGKIHPTYTSGNKFYRDIVANLLWVQRGVCAYTEQFLFDHVELSQKIGKMGSTIDASLSSLDI